MGHYQTTEKVTEINIVRKGHLIGELLSSFDKIFERENGREDLSVESLEGNCKFEKEFLEQICKI